MTGLTEAENTRQDATSTIPNPAAPATESGSDRPTWSASIVWLGFILAFFACCGGIALAVYQEHYWLLAPLILLTSYLMHVHLIAFHEASHGLLCPNRLLNDAMGMFIGVNSFMSLTLYRSAHRTHHAHLGTERDEELWPFNDPRSPRWFRRLAAFTELFFGLIYTPLLFLRSFLRKGSPIRGRGVRSRVWLELGMIVLVVLGMVTAATYFGVWVYVFYIYLVPAWLAGNLQSWRKYVEHMGLTDREFAGRTRSIVPSNRLGHFMAWTLLHEPYHGVHHNHGQLPHERLPDFAAELSAGPLYPSYRLATLAMIRTLGDPRIGPQWVKPAREDIPRENVA